MKRLVQEKEQAKQALEAKKVQFRQGIKDLIRLEKLIAQIEKEISDRICQFQSKYEDLERRRLEILNDDTLTEEEKQKLLQKLDLELGEIKKTYASDMQLLENRRDTLTAASKAKGGDIDAFKEDLMKKYHDEMADLEGQKLNATPSELILINQRIKELTGQFNENLELLDHAEKRPEYFVDEFGRRYYVNKDGIKVFKRDSNASEYMLDENGEMKKIKEATEILSDEKGEYYLDSFGKKIYTKMYFNDEIGCYFINDKGQKIYLVKNFTEKAESVEIIPEEAAESIKESEKSVPKEDVTPVEEDTSDKKAREDAEYIKCVVGPKLVKGLAVVALRRPDDPIQFLADYFRSEHDKLVKSEAEAKFLAELAEEREKYERKIEEMRVNMDYFLYF